MVLRSEKIKMEEKRPPQNEQFDELIPKKRRRSRSGDSQSTHSASSNDTHQSLDSSVEYNNDDEIDAIDDDLDDRKDDDDDYDEGDVNMEEQHVEEQGHDDACSTDPLSKLTNDQRVVLYTLFLCCGFEHFGTTEGILKYFRRAISIDDDVSMGDIDFWKTVKDLEDRGLVRRDIACIGNIVHIPYDKENQIMRSYRENCLLSDIDKDFFIQVASKESMDVYLDVFIDPADYRSVQDTIPITLMRVILEIHPGVIEFFEENYRGKILPLSFLRELPYVFQQLRHFILEWCCLKKIFDPIGWTDNCRVERIKSVYSASLIFSCDEEFESLFQSPLKSSILCIILMSENYKVCTNTLKEKDQEFQKVFPSLHHGQQDTFSDTMEEMEKRDKTIIVDRKNSVIGFSSEDVRHQVMGYFVMECLRTDEDYEKYIKLSSVDSLLEYARPWWYRYDDRKRFVYVPEEMEDALIETLGLDAIRHVMVQDNNSLDESVLMIREKIVSNVNVPEEILDWDYDARCRYVECAKKGTQTIHRARAMIVGCAGAGKTTMLKRLQKKSLEELKDVQSTIGLEVYEDLFEIVEDQCTLKAETEETNKEGKGLLSVMDFGGQCAYYACHQVYLSRRAFYLLVIDISKPFHNKVDPKLCKQEGTMFGDWTYGEYILFWLKSVHTYCENDAPVILVGTHLDKERGQTADTFFNKIVDHLEFNEHLRAHLDRKRCFVLGLQIEDDEFGDTLSELEKCIVSIAKQDRWKDSIPTDWALCEIVLRELRQKRKIISVFDLERKCFADNQEKISQIRDILKFFHDIGMIINFNEENLSDTVIVDIQWFIDAFKYVITDPNHVRDAVANSSDWRAFNSNGHISRALLYRIWKDRGIDENRCARDILLYMQRLGLIAVGESSHYIPCMNKRTFGDIEEIYFQELQNKTSVLVFRFPFLPYFFFFRLIVVCFALTNGEWEILEDNGLCLYKNVACFVYKQHHVALAVNNSSIQLQVFQPSNTFVKKSVTLEVRETIEWLLSRLIGSFHKKIMYTVGYQCSNQEVFREYDHCFVEETAIYKKGNVRCPRHGLQNHHIIRESFLLSYWKDVVGETPAAVQFGDSFSCLYEEGLKKFHFKTFEELSKIGRDALQIYFDTIFSAQDFIRMKARKDKIKKQLRLDDHQCNLLFPADNSVPSSKTFDVTMMYRMLRNGKPNVPPPANGWGKTPDANHTFCTDDVERIRIYRNEVEHKTKATSFLAKAELEDKGRDLIQAILRLSNGSLQQEITNAMKCAC